MHNHPLAQEEAFKGNKDFYFEVIIKCRLLMDINIDEHHEQWETLFLIVHDAPTALVDAGLSFREGMVSPSTYIKMSKVLISSNKNHLVFQLHLLVTAVYGVSGICQLFLKLLLSSHCLKSTFGVLQARFAGSSSPSWGGIIAPALRRRLKVQIHSEKAVPPASLCVWDTWRSVSLGAWGPGWCLQGWRMKQHPSTAASGSLHTQSLEKDLMGCT